MYVEKHVDSLHFNKNNQHIWSYSWKIIFFSTKFNI